MRKKLDNIHEVMHFWANKVQAEGECGSVFFRDSTIYSYGTHFPMARHLPNGSVAVTTRSRSLTTSKHLHGVQSAASHLKQIHVDDVISSPQIARPSVEAQIQQALEQAAVARTSMSRGKRLQTAVELAENFNLYSEANGSKQRIKVKNVDLAKIKKQIEARDRKAAALALAHAQARAQAQAEGRANWRAGINSSHYHDPVMLRLGYFETRFGEPGYQTVETSAGARIPVNDAKRLWPFIQRVIRGEKDYEVGMHLGDYRLTQIKADGSIVVGCHQIPFNEIEMIARSLDLIEEPATV